MVPFIINSAVLTSTWSSGNSNMLSGSRILYACTAQGIDRHADFPWAAIVLFVLLLFASGYATFMKNTWDTETFVSSYSNNPQIMVLYFGYNLVKTTKVVSLQGMPIREFVEAYSL